MYQKLPFSGLWMGLLAFGLLAQACSFSAKATRRLLKAAEQKPYDLVIVPGVPFENGNWSQVMMIRVYWSKYLYERGIAKNVMYSGSAVYTPYFEADIMRLYGMALGIPKEHIYTEKKAEHSTENVYYSYKLARKLGFQRIALASDPFQTKLVRKFVRQKVSRDIGLVPIVFNMMRALQPPLTGPAIDYQQAFNKEFVPLTQRETFWQRFRGTRGLRLDARAYE